MCPEVGINFKRRLALWPHIYVFVFEKWTSILDKIVFEGKNDRHMMIGSLNPFRYSQIFQYQVTAELWNCNQKIIYWHTCYKTLKGSILLSFKQLGWHKFSIYILLDCFQEMGKMIPLISFDCYDTACTCILLKKTLTDINV